jgi:hypothetical protein
MAEQLRGSFEKFVDSPYYSESELCGGAVINGLQHVFEKWAERCKKCIACQWRYFETETVTTPSQSPDSRVIRWVHKLFKRPSLLRHAKKGSFKTTVTQTLTTVRGMKITPLLRYLTTTTWHNSHRLPLHNSGALPPVHEPFKRPKYIYS